MNGERQVFSCWNSHGIFDAGRRDDLGVFVGFTFKNFIKLRRRIAHHRHALVVEFFFQGGLLEDQRNFLA